MSTITNLADLDLITETWTDSVTNAINGLDAWTSYTPTYSGGAIGNGTAVGRYMRIANMVFYEATITFGSTTTVTAIATVTLPVTGSAANVSATHKAHAYDSSATTYYPLFSNASTTTAASYALLASGAYVSWTGTTNLVPFTWATGDVLTFAGWYLAA